MDNKLRYQGQVDLEQNPYCKAKKRLVDKTFYLSCKRNSQSFYNTHNPIQQADTIKAVKQCTWQVQEGISRFLRL